MKFATIGLMSGALAVSTVGLSGSTPSHRMTTGHATATQAVVARSR
jgi:hypothetical protein